MSDDLPDLSEFDKYLDDEDLEKLRRAEASGSGASAKKSGKKPQGKGTRGKGRPRRWRWLLMGLVVGVAGTAFLPDLIRPYLPPALRLGETEAEGLVLEKRREGERLLLTVDTDRGATLATFTRRVPEIDLLVSAGDSVTLGLGAYAPLVEDPTLAGVRKGGGTAVDGGSESDPGTSSPVGPSPAGAPDTADAGVRGEPEDTTPATADTTGG